MGGGGGGGEGGSLLSLFLMSTFWNTQFFEIGNGHY